MSRHSNNKLDGQEVKGTGTLRVAKVALKEKEQNNEIIMKKDAGLESDYITSLYRSCCSTQVTNAHCQITTTINRQVKTFDQ